MSGVDLAEWLHDYGLNTGPPEGCNAVLQGLDARVRQMGAQDVLGGWVKGERRGDGAMGFGEGDRALK